MFFGGIPLFQTGTVYQWCNVRGKQTLTLPLLQMHRVHGAAVHTGIPFGSSTSGQNTPFPMASQQKSCCQSFLWPVCGNMHGKGKLILCMPLWQWGCGDFHQLRHKQRARIHGTIMLLWPRLLTFSCLARHPANCSSVEIYKCANASEPISWCKIWQESMCSTLVTCTWSSIDSPSWGDMCILKAGWRYW